MQKENILTQKSTKELTFQDIIHILKSYIWSILFITLLITAMSYYISYFKPSIYLSSAIMKVKGHKQSTDIIDTTSVKSLKNVDEEITLLQTYKINKNVLEKINFQIRYFKKNKFNKKTEIYLNNSPITIKKLKILNKEIIGRYITLTPHGENKYDLTYKVPYTDKIKKLIFKNKIFEFKTIKNINFGETITTPFFKFSVDRNFKFSNNIEFQLFGNQRNIFENLIQNHLKVSQLKKETPIIQIQFEDPIPKRANLYINLLIESFINYNIKNKNTTNNKTLTYINHELTHTKQELTKLEKKLEQHQINSNIVKPSVQAELYIQKLSNIEMKIAENQLKRKLIDNLIEFVKKNYNLSAISPSVEKLNDTNTLKLISNLQDKQLIEEELSQEYTDMYPKLKILRRQIASIIKKIKNNLKSQRKDIIYNNTNLQHQKEKLESKMKMLPLKERNIVDIKRNYEVKSGIYEYLLKKQAEYKIIQLAISSNYQIIDKAYSSNTPIKPKLFFSIVIGSLLGLILGSTLAFIRYFSNQYITNKSDIEKITSLPIYGSIPYLKQPKNKIQIHLKVKSPFAESFRTLRTNLQFVSNKDKEGTVMLITSTIAGEGKSTTSANLATIMEMARYKTILINFDLRKPTLHHFFNIDNSRGICNFLNGECDLDNIIYSTEFAHLDIIPSGPIPLDPSELILSKSLASLFKQLKKRYDYIIIDTAPIGIVSDTKTLMQYSDLNLIIVREDYAKKDFILTLEEIISKHHFTNVGLILNASKSKNGEYGYGYSYEYK